VSWTVDTALVEAAATLLGRPVPVYDAVLRIMSSNLNTVLDEFGFPDRALIKSFHYAGEDLGSLDDMTLWPKLLVGGSTRTEEFGTGHQDELHVMLTCAWPPAVGRREFQEAMDVTAVARALMRVPQFAGRLQDPDHPTRTIWSHCLPLGFRAVPPDFARYSGYIAEFLVRQHPNNNLWTTL